ncbi:hypothetical protein JCM3770_000305 [Rhodotorula araucariae]
MGAVYSEPSYIFAEHAATALSDTRVTRLSPTALVALNHLVDELLHLVVHAALHSTPSITTLTSSPTGGASSLLPTPLAQSEVLTTERFKSALARILGPTALAKECILEAELAVRELVRRGSPALRGDGALKRAHAMWASPVLGSGGARDGDDVADGAALARQAAEVFGALRAWTMQISGLGAACPASAGTAPLPLPEHLVTLMPPQPAPTGGRSAHLTFILALYVERVLTTLGAHLLRLIAGVAARSATAEVAGVADVETALMEDTLVWSWLQGLRVSVLIADEAARERERAKRGSPILSQRALPPRGSASAGGMTTTGASPVAVPPGSAALARNPSLSGSTVVVSTPGTRRPSAESTLSSPTVAGIAYPRKSSSSYGLGMLSPGASTSVTPPADDAFDQLLNSGRTLKLSSTPDRLRNFENRTNRLSTSSSLPTITPSSSSTASKDSSSRRLRARDPQPRHLFAEEDEDAASAVEDAERVGQESLMDLIRAGPPDPGTGAGSVPHSRRGSLVPRRPVPADDPSHPMSVAMRVQDSQGSVTTVDSGLSDESHASASPRVRALKAKDEKRDLASERQINHDLVDFFSNAPPPPPLRTDRFSTAYVDEHPNARAPISPKKSKGGLRGLVSMVTGSSRAAEKDAEPRASADSPVSLPPAPPPPPPQHRPRPGSPPGMQRTVRSRSLGQQGVAAAPLPGTSEMGSAANGGTAYAPPPGLGNSKSAGSGEHSGGVAETRQSQRAKSVAAQGSAPMHDDDALHPPPPMPTTSVVPPSLPRGKSAYTNGHAAGAASGSRSASASRSDLGLTGLPPPIPPVSPEAPDTFAAGPRRRRSSSLTRDARAGAHTATTGSSLAPSSAPGGRTCEASETAALSRGTPASPMHLVEVESDAAPVTVVPSGVIASDDSAPSSADSRELPPLPLSAVSPAPQSVDEQATVVAGGSVAIAPVLAALAAYTLGGEAAAAARPGPMVGPTDKLLLVTQLSPVEEVPTPGLHAPELFTPPLVEPEQSTTPFASPLLASASPALPGHAPLTNATLPGARSVVALLKDLRAAMLLAQTRDECIELVEGMLRDQARRVEALAQRERGAVMEADTRAADGVKARDWVEERCGAEEMQARVAEALLCGEPMTGRVTLVRGGDAANHAEDDGSSE